MKFPCAGGVPARTTILCSIALLYALPASATNWIILQGTEPATVPAYRFFGFKCPRVTVLSLPLGSVGALVRRQAQLPDLAAHGRQRHFSKQQPPCEVHGPERHPQPDSPRSDSDRSVQATGLEGGPASHGPARLHSRPLIFPDSSPMSTFSTATARRRMTTTCSTDP